MKHGSDAPGASAKHYLDPQLRRALANHRLARARHDIGRHVRSDPPIERRRDEAREAVPPQSLETGATPADGQFLCKAAMLNMTALEAGHCAEFQSEDTGLRGLAAQMVVVLGRIDSECRQLAERHAAPVAEALDAEHRSQLAALQRLDGAAFERSYLRKYAMEAPLELIRLCGCQLTQGSDEGLRAAAGRWMQDLRTAVTLARQFYFAPQAH
jgi:predicted outer membrane protein